MTLWGSEYAKQCSAARGMVHGLKASLVLWVLVGLVLWMVFGG